ncbi:MAG: LysM peptidoglycan-binding domain-containing protein [Halanaerobiales bacterium]
MNNKILTIITIIILLIFTFNFNVQAIRLNTGDKGEEVKKVQKILDNLGYDIKSDGIYGNRTKSTVKDFQKDNDLSSDGIVGDKTYKLLKKRNEDIEYEVKKGDSLSSIAKKFETTIEDIKERNDLSTNKIVIGQNLFIPKTGSGGGEEKKLYDNIQHEVQPGDSLSLLAKKYGTEVETIKLANNINSNKIYAGQTLVIPHLGNKSNRPFKLAKGVFIWPIMGRISSGFGWRKHPIKGSREFHQGIDIAAPIGENVRAAAGGKVIQSGWINGFGKTIIVEHGNNIQTLYAHNSRLLVSNGKMVKLGEKIAETGSTGLSTGSHLHFGLIVNDKPINPMKYLP